MDRSSLIVGALTLGGLLQTPLALGEQRTAAATTLEQQQQVQALEQKAREAQISNDLERARGLRLQAFLLQANADTALELGRTELELRRYRDSAEHLDYALRTLPDTASEKTRALTKRALAEAKAQIAVVQATTNRTGAEIRVDGKSIGRAPLPSSIYLEPGTHDITAYFENNSITRPVAVLAGQEYQLSLPLVTRAAAQRPKPPPPVSLPVADASPRRQPASEASRNPAPLLIGGAVFAAGLATGIVFGLDAATQYKNADDMRARRASAGCTGDQSLSGECMALRAAAESGDRSRNWSVVGFAGAGVALLGTLAYWYWPWRKSENPNPVARWQLAPVVSGSTSGLMLRAEY